MSVISGVPPNICQNYTDSQKKLIAYEFLRTVTSVLQGTGRLGLEVEEETVAPRGRIVVVMTF